MLFFALLYGHISLKNYEALQDGPDVCVVQGNIPQGIKIDPGEKQQEEILMKYVNLSLKTVGKGIDLIIWPETMVPGILNIDPARFLTERLTDCPKNRFKNWQMLPRANLLVGGTAIDIVNNKYPLYFNTAFYYDRKGKLVDRYDKIHSSPISGNLFPLKVTFPFFNHLVPYDVSLSSGKRRTIFELGKR